MHTHGVVIGTHGVRTVCTHAYACVRTAYVRMRTHNTHAVCTHAYARAYLCVRTVYVLVKKKWTLEFIFFLRFFVEVWLTQT